jgi:hypothetical protein
MVEVVRCHCGFARHGHKRPGRCKIAFNGFSRSHKSSMDFHSSRRSKRRDPIRFAPAFGYRVRCSRAQCFKQPTKPVWRLFGENGSCKGIEQSSERAASGNQTTTKS